MSFGARTPEYRPPPGTLDHGRYVLADTLGAGGMAAVYRVHDTVDGVDRAVKVLNERASASPKMRSRFLNEATTMSKLDHPNIVHIHDLGEEDGFSYFVMDLAEGGALSKRLRQLGFLDADVAMRMIREALLGLEHAHSHGVVHRDIKPQNLLLDSEDHLLLTDFGIARMLNDSAMRITGTGDMLGTIAYMAPEQRIDPRDVTPHADLYGIGAVLYLMVTGRRPLELAMGRLDPQVFERVPLALRPVLRKATAHRAADRYHDARAMIVALDEAAAAYEADPSA